MGDKARPRVLFVGPYPPPHSGPELGMKLFLESSLKDAFDIAFLKTNFRNSNVDKGKVGSAGVFAFFRFISALFWKILHDKPKVAYYPITPTQLGWIGRDVWCLLLCKLFKVKTVIHLRGGHLKLNFKTFHPIAKWVTRNAGRQVAVALVQANSLKDQFDGLVSGERVKVLTQAIDTAEYENKDLGKYNPNIVLFMGHMTKAKGFCDLLRVIPLVANDFPGVEFHCAGTLRKGERGVFFDQTTGRRINYEDPIAAEAAIKSGPFARNYFNHGVVSGKEKIELIRSCNFFVLPSYSEGFSRALLEAMCMGKPVVCTPVGAQKEAVVHGVHGLVVPPGDADALAQSVKMLLQDERMRNTMAANNYKYARENYDIKIVAKNMEAHLSEVLV